MTPIDHLKDRLSLPVLASPMFIISTPELVIAQCLGGIIGSFPALNARPKEDLEGWLTRIETALAEAKAAEPARTIAPYAVNQIVHQSNDRLEHDMEVCVRHQVPIIITSLSTPGEVVGRVHGYGGMVFHDVTTIRHAEKALEAGVDGLILVCAGAGGHAGNLSPFALVGEVRRFYDGPLILSGAITTGASVLAAEAMGADLAYMGTRFIATTEARAADAYKSMIVSSHASDIVHTPFFTGVHGNYLKPSITAAGLDPDHLGDAGEERIAFASSTHVKPWKDIWGAGQGVGQIDAVQPTAEVIASLRAEYARARRRLAVTDAVVEADA
ncbi:nitronate monooxygenase [Streptomyces sp. NA02950]|uniref:NAD(P)H-dependent flavin oxidoreductase n=1 Tax=Streptomyces sp. NA02950 TaxID=2742137 RepID=UPI001591645F|nr:nitronate monooxygenase family protein [Streptomyces sp. NA02950]QKV92446.1 nitronate monooxygenase [Streptomyces sp. NA02950]